MNPDPGTPTSGGNWLAYSLATWFGAGFLPKAPGTWGSLAALPLAWLLLEFVGLYGLASATFLLLAAGVWAAQKYIEKSGRNDPSEVVIDEVVGQWLTILVMALFSSFHDSVANYGLAFVAFRLFDIWKPFPIAFVERRFDDGLGIMIDDLVAAVYAAAAGLLLGAVL